MPQRDDATAAIERIYRTEYGRVVASLVRRFGDIDIAEEAAGEALLAAVERWPRDGVPPNPGGWLTTTAGHRAIDRIHPRRPAAAAGPQRRRPGGVRRRDRGHRQPRRARLSPTEAWQSGAMSHHAPHAATASRRRLHRRLAPAPVPRPARRRPRARRRAAHVAAGHDPRGAPAVGRDHPADRQGGRDRFPAGQRASRGGDPDPLRGGRAGRRQALDRAAPGPAALRRPRGARPHRAGRDGRAVAGEDARRLPAWRRGPRRRDPRPAHRAQRAPHRAQPGLQPQHPRRRAHRARDARPARRPPRRLARRAPGRRRGARDGHDRLPRRGPGADVRPRRRGTPRRHRRLPQPRVAAERAAARRDLRPASRARRTGRVRRLGVVRRRREDDQEGPGDPGVHRPDRRRRHRAGPPRPRGAARALPAGRAGRDDDRLRRRGLLRGARPQGAAARSTPSRCGPTSTSPRCAPACSR